jgi:hypothetical protein
MTWESSLTLSHGCRSWLQVIQVKVTPQGYNYSVRKRLTVNIQRTFTMPRSLKPVHLRVCNPDVNGIPSRLRK